MEQLSMIASRPSRACLSSLLLLGVVAGCGRTSSSGAQGDSESSTARSAPATSAGAELLRRVTSSYGRVPAVLVTATVQGSSGRFSVILRRGVVIAEQFVGGAGRTATKLVAPPHSPTYALQPGTACWRQLSAANPQALMDIGERFPVVPGAVVLSAPQRTPVGWLLRVRITTTTAIYAIDRATLRVDSITFTQGRGSVTERVRALSAAPALIKPVPRC